MRSENLPEDDDDLKLTSEGCEEYESRGLRAWAERQDQEDLLEAARQALQSADWPCYCRPGYTCQRCRVQARLYPLRPDPFACKELPW